MSWVEFQVFLGQGLEDLSTFKSGWVKAAILTSTFFNLGYFQVQKDQLFSSQLKEKLKKLELKRIAILCCFYEINFKTFYVSKKNCQNQVFWYVWNQVIKLFFGKVKVFSTFPWVDLKKVDLFELWVNPKLTWLDIFNLGQVKSRSDM